MQSYKQWIVTFAYFTCRLNNVSLPEIEEVVPVASIGDGYWTNPYYDCGGGDIWMVTYAAPIFYPINGTVSFR